MARLALVFLAAAAGAVAALGVTSRTEGPVSAGAVELRVRADGRGETELRLPPLGRITAPTHVGPMSVSARVTSLDVERVQALVGERDPAARLREDAVLGLEGLARRLVLKALLLSAVVGAGVAAMLPRRRWIHLPLGALGGALGVAVMLAWTWRGYDPTAFERSPKFEGALEEAPPLLATIQRHIGGIDVVRNRVGLLGARIAELYASTATDDAPGGSDVRILHVSDIHSNPLGVEVVRRLVESFDVDAVLDTGDLTSFGSPLESRIGELVADVPVRYLLVPGNHDSDANRAAFTDIPGVRVLDGDVVSVRGVRILGIADPTFTAEGDVSTDEANEAKHRAAPSVARAVRRDDPDVLAVHDLRQAEEAVGGVPLVVAGHIHERSSQEQGETRLLTVGSTGATGLGSFTAESDLAYEAEILHFRGGALVAVDYVSLEGLDGSFVVEHTVVPSGSASTR